MDQKQTAVMTGNKIKIETVIKNLEKLDTKLTRNTGELHDEIDKKILDHERRYHNAGHN